MYGLPHLVMANLTGLFQKVRSNQPLELQGSDLEGVFDLFRLKDLTARILIEEREV